MVTNTTDEFWSYQPPGAVSAVSLHQYAYAVATIGGSRFGIPTLRGQNIEVAYRAGQMFRPKYPDQRTVSLVMFAAGIDPATGNPAADQRLGFNNNWLALRQLFFNQGANGSSQGTLTRRWFLGPQGSGAIVTASALAEVAGSMDPTMTGRYRADFTVDLLLADPYFYGTTLTQTLAYNTPTVVNNPGEGAVGPGYSSSLSGFSVTFNGPLTLPVLTNSTANATLSLGLTLPGAYSVTLDILNDTAIDSLAANQIGVVSHTGARAWMVLLGTGYNGSGNNTLTLTSSNGADTGNCVLNYNPPYV